MIFLSILDFKIFDSPEAIAGLSAIVVLIVTVIAGFIYKWRQSKK